jgi:DNA-binding transcriptional LysR family regulator
MYAKMHNWDDFRYFHAVATFGSFSAAAQALGVNHSTVSRRIQVLEERHGVRLFERNQQGYSMTEAGVEAFEVVEEIHERSLKIARILQGKDARLEGPINLTMPHDFFESCMAGPVKHFIEENPAININLMVRHGLRDLGNREADLAIRLTSAPPDYLVGQCITRFQHGVYKQRKLKLGKNVPIICWRGEHDVPDWAQHAFDNPHVVLRVDDLVSMYQAIKSGLGVARIPCFYPDMLAEADVRRMDIELPLSEWGVWLLSHVDLRGTARVNHCKKFLRQELEKLVPVFLGETSL